MPSFTLAEEALPATTLFGFREVRQEELTDISSTAHVYEHEQSGASLIWLENSDPFKVFAATFKTKPQDSSGAAHIVEHALLGGSRKYKSDDIFYDMYSRSTNAFMNAMTYPDKTIFPIASRDPQDFFNLTDVYLDSVFFPMILENPQFFAREGWRYELFSPEEELSYNGVVYNEMLGAMSDPMRKLLYSNLASIFPDTFYVHNSGGDPNEIPSLSYEEFLDFYRTYYSPSNTMLYFYGDLDILAYLEHIDRDYLSHFSQRDEEVVYEKQAAFVERREHVSYYNLDDAAPLDNQAYMVLNYLTGEGGLPEETFMNMVLSQVLFDSSSAPVKLALLDAGIGVESGSLSMNFNQNSLGIAVLNANESQKEDFVQIVEDTLRQVVAEGLDQENILATINILEMAYREANGTYGLKGMDYLSLILDSYNYGGDPFAYLHFTDIFNDLRDKIASGAYEAYIQERVLDNPSSSLCLLLPQKGLAADLEAKVEADLAAYQAELSDDEIADLIKRSTKLRDEPIFAPEEYYLPSLSLAEIDPQVNEIPFQAEARENYTLVSSPQVTGGINYVSIQFDLSVVEPADLPYVNLLARLLANVDTDNYDKGELEKAIFMYTGGIGFNASNAQNRVNGDYDARFEISSSATLENMAKMLELVTEISQHTQFTDQKWIGEQIKALRNTLEVGAASNAAGLGLQRIRAYFDPLFAYREKLNGLDFIRFLQELDDNFATDPQPHLDKLAALSKQIFNRPNLVIGLAASADDLETLQTQLDDFAAGLPVLEQERAKFQVEAQPLNEGIAINSEANYVLKAGKLEDQEGELKASSNVLTLILDNLYLYPEIRAKGGAYGAYSLVDNYDNFVVYSYSDPNIVETLDAFDQMGDFLANLALPDEALEQILIGYFKAYPVPGKDAANTVVYRWLNGFSNEFYAQEAQDVLDTKLEDIQAYGELLREIMQEDNYLLVLGNGGQIQEAEELFKNLTSIVPTNLE
ncbi:MAG: insulinase family protein [Eubacteriales bacterium]|nr:insulinase family protein [Eubacteriales bacterium]